MAGHVGSRTKGRCVVAVVLLLCAAGCVEGSLHQREPDGADTNQAPGPDAGPPEDAPPPQSCRTGVFCEGTCCSAGQLCQSGTCVDSCSGTRCGTSGQLCCTSGESCVQNACRRVGKPCQSTDECPAGEYCAKSAGRCVGADKKSCKWRPPVGRFNPKREGRFDGVRTNGHLYNRSIGSPTVADIDNDSVPEIAVVLYRESLDGALVAVLNGEDRSLLAYGAVEDIEPNSAGVAVANLDPSTPELEVAAVHDDGGLVALKYSTGSQRLTTWWTARQGALGEISDESAPAIGDLDGEGTPEVVLGFSIVSNTGQIWRGINRGSVGGQQDDAAITSLVDLDGATGANGKRDLEVVAGNKAMKIDASMLWDVSGQVGDGYSAVGDFGNDGKPEVVTVSEGKVYVLDGKTGRVKFGPRNIPGGGEGGAPTIADFDGDGNVEFSAAGRGMYAVYDLDCQPGRSTASNCVTQSTNGILWQREVQDLSSSRTGSSVFDFEGDGQAEVVYNDECYLRIFSGATGDILFEKPNTSRTGSEYPIVADVDKDYNAEIVVVSNNDQIDRDGCERNYPGYPAGGTTGVFVYGDANDTWVPTRRIWNQHAYHITNVANDGSIPAQEKRHYQSRATNSFRLNVQTDGVLDAPDLVVEAIEMKDIGCESSPVVQVRATVKNDGKLGVGAGVPVVIRAEIDGMQTQVGRTKTTKRLAPGESETVTVDWSLPQGARSGTFEVRAEVDDKSTVNECREMNNTTKTTVDGSRFGRPRIQATSLEVDDGSCGFENFKIGIDVTLENTGQTPLEAGVPLVLEAVDPSGGTHTIESIRTSKRLPAGGTEVVKTEWVIVTQLQNDAFDVRLRVDPRQEVLSCGGTSGRARADCTTGG